jgi:hypothetical protein
VYDGGYEAGSGCWLNVSTSKDLAIVFGIIPTSTLGINSSSVLMLSGSLQGRQWDGGGVKRSMARVYYGIRD